MKWALKRFIEGYCIFASNNLYDIKSALNINELNGLEII